MDRGVLKNFGVAQIQPSSSLKYSGNYMYHLL
jgi:hypothetical protein